MHLNGAREYIMMEFILNEFKRDKGCTIKSQSLTLPCSPQSVVSLPMVLYLVLFHSVIFPEYAPHQKKADSFFLIKTLYEGFPGGAVVENLPANAGDMGSSPGLGRYHMPWSN